MHAGSSWHACRVLLLLLLQGYDDHTTSTSEEALTLFTEREVYPDVVLLDSDNESVDVAKVGGVRAHTAVAWAPRGSCRHTNLNTALTRRNAVALSRAAHQGASESQPHGRHRRAGIEGWGGLCRPVAASRGSGLHAQTARPGRARSARRTTCATTGEAAVCARGVRNGPGSACTVHACMRGRFLPRTTLITTDERTYEHIMHNLLLPQACSARITYAQAVTVSSRPFGAAAPV